MVIVGLKRFLLKVVAQFVIKKLCTQSVEAVGIQIKPNQHRLQLFKPIPVRQFFYREFFNQLPIAPVHFAAVHFRSSPVDPSRDEFLKLWLGLRSPKTTAAQYNVAKV